MTSKKNRKGVVYSTNPDFDYEINGNEEMATLLPSEQMLNVSLDNKQRKGKTVTLIQGFVGNDDDLKALAKLLKSKCGVGGAAKDGEIIVQGAFKEKVAALLKEEGYRTKLK